MGQGARADRGNVTALEGLIVLSLVIGAMAFLDFEVRSAADPSVRIDLARAVRDLLLLDRTLPDPTGAHPSMMDRWVAEALRGDGTLLESRFAKVLPTGALFKVSLGNGEGEARLHGDREPGGEAVSASVLWSPRWGALLAVPRLDPLDAARGGLEVQALPLPQGRGLTGQAGVLAEVELLLPEGGVVNRTVFAPLPNGTGAGPGAALALLDPAGGRAYALARAASNTSLWVEARETQGRALAAGAKLEVRLPAGFTGVQLSQAANPGWTDLAVSGDATLGWKASARLGAALSGAARGLNVTATQPAWGALHLVEASLDGGLHGSLAGVLVTGGAPSRSAAVPPGRGPWLSLPGLAPWSAAAPAGLVVAYPDEAARTLTVQRLTLTPVGGATLDAATGTWPLLGWSAADGVLEWVGARSLANDAALEFRFDLRASAPVDAASLGHAGPTLDLRNGFTLAAARQASPGVFDARVQGRNATVSGFNQTAGAWWATVSGTHREVAAKGNASYAASATGLVAAATSDLARGVDEGWLAIDTPRVPLGGEAMVRWDLRRLASEAGLDGALFKCYTSAAGAWVWVADRAACDATPGALPWQLAKAPMQVALRLHHPAPAGPAGGPLAWESAGLAPQGSAEVPVALGGMLGTHGVELRATLTMRHTDGTEQGVQARLLAALEVHRPGQEPGPAQYAVVAQAWLPDWG